MNIILNDSNKELGRRAAEQGAELIRKAIDERGEAFIIVATGVSQFDMLEHLIQADGIYWPAVTAFHLDEYVGLPFTHPASFRLYLWERFVSKLPLPLKEFHFINAEKDPEQECVRLGKLIEACEIDVAFAGIGENGHMAFNDPPADFETTKPYLVVALDDACRKQQLGEGWFPSFDDVPQKAISMSIHQIMASQTIIACVLDERKANAVQACMELEIGPEYPASCLRNHAQAFLYLDPAAASCLSSAPSPS